MMEIVQTWIAPRANDRTAAGADLIVDYMERTRRFCPCGREAFAGEEGFWSWVGRGTGKDRREVGGRTYVVVLDSGGKQMSSEEFAGRMGRLRDEGVRRMVFAIGPADGWSEASRARADLVLSLGLMTLPHQLARVVLAEQVYRALTMLSGHPYHCGH